MYHIFFIHSSVNGHLGSFHVLAIVDSAALKVYGRNQHNIVKIKKKIDTALRWVQGITASNNLECTAYCPILFNLRLFGGLCLLMRKSPRKRCQHPIVTISAKEDLYLSPPPI